MKFSPLPYVPIKAWQKLWPQHFKPGVMFTTYRAYKIQTHSYYEDKVSQQALEPVHHSVFGNLGQVRYIDYQIKESDELHPNIIKADTFYWWETQDFQNMLNFFYKRKNIMGFLIKCQVEKVNPGPMMAINKHLRENQEYLINKGVKI